METARPSESQIAAPEARALEARRCRARKSRAEPFPREEPARRLAARSGDRDARPSAVADAVAQGAKGAGRRGRELSPRDRAVVVAQGEAALARARGGDRRAPPQGVRQAHRGGGARRGAAQRRPRRLLDGVDRGARSRHHGRARRARLSRQDRAHPPRSARRRRAHHAVELPGRHPAAHDHSRAPRGQRGRLQAERDHAARRRARRRSSSPASSRTACSRSCKAAATSGAALVDADVDLVVFTGSVATGRKVAVALRRATHPLLARARRKGRGHRPRATQPRAHRARPRLGRVHQRRPELRVDRARLRRASPSPTSSSSASSSSPRSCAPASTRRSSPPSGSARSCAATSPRRSPRAARCSPAARPRRARSPSRPRWSRSTREDTPLMRDETFGPILPIVVVDGEDDAIARTNASRFGLTTSVWTRRFNHAHDLAKKLKSGVVTINNHGFTARSPPRPWTGTGDSGYGITNSPHALARAHPPALRPRGPQRRQARALVVPVHAGAPHASPSPWRAPAAAPGSSGASPPSSSSSARVPKRLLGG